MKKRNIDFGVSEPKKFVFGDDIILYNHFTGRKIFTTKKKIDSIPSEEIKKLKQGKISLTIPRIKKFRIEITSKCNCLCDYCLVYNNEISKREQSMDMKTAINIVSKFNKSIKNGSMMIIGGEPLVNFEVLNYMTNNVEGNIQLFTNGILIDKEIAKSLSKPNIKTFVSFDGWKKLNFHRIYRNGKPSYEDSLRGYENLLNQNANTAINCLVTGDNVDYMKEIVEFFYENYKETSFGLSMPHYTINNNFRVNPSKYASEMLDIFDYCKEKGIYVDQIGKRLKAVVEESFRYYSCKIAGEQTTFYPDGVETLCTKLDTLDEFKNKNPSYLESKLPINSENCLDCNSLFICGGGCFWDSYFNPLGRDTKECLFNKAILNKILIDMTKNSPKNKVVEKGFFGKFYSSMLKK